MRIGFIATSSLAQKTISGDTSRQVVATRYGNVQVEIGTVGDDEVVFVKRSGARHPLEPGRINFRANVLALRDLDVNYVLSTCIVGSLNEALGPGSLVILDQFLDFTRHREPTIFDEYGFSFTDMTDPYCSVMRAHAEEAAHAAGIGLHMGGCYVGVDGPRYETAAEVRMFRTLGGDVVGHTGVTEAIMLREAGLCHAAFALVTNYAAGMTTSLVSNEHVAVERERHSASLELLMSSTLTRLQRAPSDGCDCASAPGHRQIPPWHNEVGYDSQRRADW